MNEKQRILPVLRLLAVLLLAIALTVGLGGCGSEDSSDSAQQAEPQTENTEQHEASHEKAKKEHHSSGSHAGSASSSRAMAEKLAKKTYSGSPYIEVNGDRPAFTRAQRRKARKSFQHYGDFDKYYRCTTATASLSTATMPAEEEERGDISDVHPSGWWSGMGWERCHLIGWQLSGQNDNAENLITGTHYFNVTGMLPFENDVADYIKETHHHVLYRVTPVYRGREQVARGVEMEAQSVEDRNLSYNVYVFNVEPGEKINYKTGEVRDSDASGGSSASSSGSSAGTAHSSTKSKGVRKYVVNTNTGKFHYPSCSSAKQTAAHNREVVRTTRKKLIEEGCTPCKRCEP